MDELAQTVWLAVAPADVKFNVPTGSMVMVPVTVGEPQLPPVVKTVNVKGEPIVVVGVPEIVNVLPDTPKLTPVGNPETVAPVAVPPKL